ncbi:hypothetical protein H3S75_13610, partial [Gilliamella sp. B14384G15]
STYIKTKTDPKYIVYEMELYKIDDKGNKVYALKSTGKQNLQADKRTSVHSSLDISDPENTSYILELNLFHKIGGMSTLFSTKKIRSSISFVFNR